MIPWWHTIDLPEGPTPGGVDQRGEERKLHLPDLTGKTVLDVGCSDGYYSFLAERLGARSVMAIDTWTRSSRAAFDYARTALNSRVAAMTVDLMDYRGQFDVVLFLGVLYHLRHPLLGLERVTSFVTPGGLLILETYTATPEQSGREYFDEERPALVFPAHDSPDPHDWKFFGPNPALVHHWLKMVGFTGETMHQDHRLVVHARRG